jgi:hypothetical protein
MSRPHSNQPHAATPNYPFQQLSTGSLLRSRENRISNSISFGKYNTNIALKMIFLNTLSNVTSYLSSFRLLFVDKRVYCFSFLSARGFWIPPCIKTYLPIVNETGRDEDFVWWCCQRQLFTGGNYFTVVFLPSIKENKSYEEKCSSTIELKRIPFCGKRLSSLEKDLGS